MSDKVKTSRYIARHVNERHKITDYLLSRGIHPKGKWGNRVKYLCPIHGDTNPSFVVYTDEEGFENYYCFGCKASGDVISLHAALEKISWGKAAASLSDGLDVTIDGELEFTIREYEKSRREKSAAGIKDAFADIALKISNLGYNHMRTTNYDEHEQEFLDKLYQGVDECVWEMDLEKLEQVYEFLADYEGWQRRQMAWEQRTQAKEREDFNAYAQIGKNKLKLPKRNPEHAEPHGD